MKLPTTEIWTSGITNVPKHNRNARYTFFELDTKDIDKLHFVLDVYRANLKNCYVHELLSGYHFYNFQPIDKIAYGRIIQLMKFLNPLCPLTVLRIVPNKWKNESRYWNKGCIIGEPDTELLQFKQNIEQQKIAEIKANVNYEVVTYPFEECPTCRKSNNVYYDYKDMVFMCRTCNIQTVGRVKHKTINGHCREYSNKELDF